MNYKKFRFNAVIDWIEFEIETVKPTNFQTIKRHGELCYVEAIDPGPGGAASHFRFKIHDPTNWQHVATILDGINEDSPLLTASTLVKSIEVSFDAYSHRANRTELLELTGRFYRYLTNPVSQNQRFSGLKSRPIDRIFSNQQVKTLLDSGRAICIGNNRNGNEGTYNWECDDRYMQIYLKTTDNGGNDKLIEEKQRARIEIRLRGTALPCKTLEEWSSFNFQSLAKYFNFRIINTPLMNKAPEWYKKIVENTLAQIGATGKFQKRKHTLITLPDKELNTAVYESLRCLSLRMFTTAKA